MTKKLQLHFIGLATLAVLIVMTAVIGLINLRNYFSTRKQVFSVLDFVVVNDDALLPNPAGNDFDFSEELLYSIRYFYVTVDEKNEISDVNLEHVATVKKDDAIDYAKKALRSSSDRDYFVQHGNFYAYEKLLTKNQSTTVLFFDCSSYFESVFRFLRISIIYGLLCLMLFVFIITMFSKRAIEPVIKNMDKQKQFVTNAGHELKTPLAIISANTELMEILYGKNEWTDSTLKQVNRLTELIKNLITISRMNEQSDLALVEVNLSNIINDALPSFKTLALQQEKEIKSDVPSNLLIQGVDSSVQELVNILLDNAIKYCDDEGIIDITAAPKGRTVRLMISNTYIEGEGVDYSRFMDRFYRQDASRNEKKGYGIGLSMAEALCEQMHGKLQISYRGGMISFTATLQKS